MIDNAKRTGAAIEAHYQFLAWLASTIEKFPRSHKFTIGDRIQVAALDALEALIEATYMRDCMHHLRQANQRIEKLRFLLDSRKTIISSCTEPSQFLGFELQADGRLVRSSQHP